MVKGLLYGLLGVIGCLCFVGCQESAVNKEDNWLLVSFEKNVPLKYRMTAVRDTQIDLQTSQTDKKQKPQVTSEKLEVVITYTPIEVDPYGLTTLQAKCESATVTRTGFSGRSGSADAMTSLKGKTYTLKVSSTGMIADTSDLERVMYEVGDKAFDGGGASNRTIKNPDMINDFLAMQWFLWDSTATINDPTKTKPGMTWKTIQTVPWPVPYKRPPARVTTYTLDSFIEQENADRKARITSTYEMTKDPMESFLRPYREEQFQMRGMFGFLKGYQFNTITGKGEQIFNVDKGILEKDHQEYTLDITASFMFPLGDSVPMLKVAQTLSVELINPSAP